MERTLVVGCLLAGTGLAITVTTVALWGIGGAGELHGSNALVAGMALTVGGLQLIAVSWCRAMVDVSLKTEPIKFDEVTAPAHEVVAPAGT
jgi:hypothetical protein